MNRIQTNKLVVNLNKNVFSDTFEIFNVKTSDVHFGKGDNAARLVDDFTNEKFVLSVVYERGNSFFLLLRKSADNVININKAIKSLSGAEKLSVENVSVTTIPLNIVVQLLLNSLGTYEGKILGFHNVTGHLFFYRPSKAYKDQIKTLELKVTKEMLLDWNVRTFTSVTKREDIIFGKKKFYDYPEYVLGKDNILKRIDKGSDPKAYILRQIGNDRSTIKFLDTVSIEAFGKSKMGIICDCIDSFNTIFNGIAHLEFDSFGEYHEEQISSKMVREMNSRFQELASSHRIVLVDKVSDCTSPMCIEEVKQRLTTRFGCKVSVLKTPKSDAINIILIHEDDYYKDKLDPHDIVYKNCAIQHITIETVAHLMNVEDDKEKESGWKSVLDCIMQEVLIKEDIKCKHISMVNWEDYHYENNVIFGICRDDEDNNKHYYFMTVSPNGDFSITEKENTLFDQNEYQECIDIFSEENVIGVVKNGEDINVIYNTKLRTIPEISLLKERLQKGDNQVRNQVSREELFPSITDIKSFANDDYSLHYFSGIIGAGMKRDVPTAANVRMVKCYRFSKLFFNELLKLMAVTFVRNGQLTIMPFPFKYLLESIPK
ncbi:MAG: hypothetical protein J6Y24_14370 [Bacteroidales bacterium]|nr:hypothetical protein [Bacteroidales bacterium]